MEKVYMNSDQYRTRRNQWQNEDVSPYDFRDSQPAQNNRSLDYYDASDDEFDFETIADEMENEDYMINDNGHTDGNGCIIYEKKTVIEETEPQKTTTTWIKMTRCRNCPSDSNR